MFTKNAQGMYQSAKLSKIPGLTHGFSSRAMGDGRLDSTKVLICDALSCDVASLAQSRQVHSDRVQTIGTETRAIVPDVDGLITTKTSHKTLSVRVADCAPILLVDPTTHITAAVHAGWKGTAGAIVKHAVEEMVAQGAHPNDIVATIGPHIGMCCYVVPKERAEYFSAMYPNDAKAVALVGNDWYIDIGWINVRQLIDAGIPEAHIDAPALCTSCTIEEFFSYRKDTKESFGEMLGVIGWTDGAARSSL